MSSYDATAATTLLWSTNCMQRNIEKLKEEYNKCMQRNIEKFKEETFACQRKETLRVTDPSTFKCTLWGNCFYHRK